MLGSAATTRYTGGVQTIPSASPTLVSGFQKVPDYIHALTYIELCRSIVYVRVRGRERGERGRGRERKKRERETEREREREME